MKNYQKQEPPAWQRRLVVFIAGLFGATLLLFLAWAVFLYLAPAAS